MKRGSSGVLLAGLAAAGGAAAVWLTRRTRDRQADEAIADGVVTAASEVEPTSYGARLGLSPAQLLEDVETLGRTIQSEAARHTEAEKRAVAWAVRNKALRRRTRITDMLCRPCGKQGERQADGKRRPFSTRLQSNATSRELSRAILIAPQSADPTGGAATIFEPDLQNKLHREGRAGYTRSADDVRRDWQRGGSRLLGRIGRWELWA